MLSVVQQNFEIDGKQVSLNYSKNSFKTAYDLILRFFFKTSKKIIFWINRISQLETQTIASYQQAAEASYTYQSNVNNKVNQGI